MTVGGRDRERSGKPQLGGDQIEGRQAVRELLRAGKRRVKSVHLSTAVDETDVIAEIAELAGAQLRLVPPERLAAIARSESHQGVVALCAPLRDADLVELLRAPKTFLVALDGVTDPGNLGAVLRTAETAGATGVVLPRHRSAHVTPTVAKAAAGAIEYLPIALVSGIPAALERAAREHVWSVGLDGEADQTIDELAVAAAPLVVVLGAEGRGLSRLTRERCDVLVRIPMLGKIASLNVAAAAAVVLHEVARRRTEAEPKLPGPPG